MNFPRPLGAVTLQGAKVIAVAQFGEQTFQDRPIAITARSSKFAFQMTLQVSLNVVVVDQRVVHIYEEYGRIRGDHLGWFLLSRSHSG